ncbi:hypothetical protein KK083_24880 [Fulvivirgaceae bacterium PWU4]|uniref:Lipocalin-like domain-containing protein n=1 Tax=Chryseosolibacter histidini TaxID=2782349 RepID=A0AAP2GRZ3_9BACT|nr:hypothetical protein [Chryseosolibacter histidini]MBT1700147.1 hypothetical protein [Chryseosolibacter histidini]
MRKNLLIAVTFTSLLLLQAACDKENESAQQSISKKLTGASWTPVEVKRDGVNITTEYTSMRLTIGANTYSTTNGGLAWASSGTWAFPDSSTTTTILRDNAVLINLVLSSDAKTLDMDFVIAERQYTTGRMTGLEGVYHFRFTRP